VRSRREVVDARYKELKWNRIFPNGLLRAIIATVTVEMARLGEDRRNTRNEWLPFPPEADLTKM
jgi:hypothetical protein